MRTADERLRGDRAAQDDQEVRAAIRFAALATAAAIGFVVIAALWVSTCGGASTDTVACGPPERTMLAFGGPLILLIAGLWAFLRTYRVWRDRGTWWGCRVAGGNRTIKYPWSSLRSLLALQPQYLGLLPGFWVGLVIEVVSGFLKL